jgi:raffinose/stachyose/melibiose transport system substrate-binding protein
MTKTFHFALLATTLLGGVASAQDVTLTIESWRNDDLTIWQDTIIPAFEAQNPGIKVVFAPSAPAEYNAALNSKLAAGSAGDLITCRSLRCLARTLQSGPSGRSVGSGRDGQLLARREIRMADG